MTTSRQYADDEGDFEEWVPSTFRCRHQDCDATVKVRAWDSSDGAYTDYQYRCENGHVWWIDGIDS